MPRSGSSPILALLLLAGLCWAPPAPAQETRSERIALVEGGTRAVVQGMVRGREAVDYLIAAPAGKWMRIELTATSRSAFLNVHAPGATEAMHVGAASGNIFAGLVPVTGDYRISVHLAPAAARRNQPARYTLSVAVVDRADAATAHRQPEMADELTGGPDFWEVSGLRGGRRLNLRDGPSARERLLRQLTSGTVLRNRGCRLAEGERWCRVELPDGSLQGWVLGRYLRESVAPPPAAARPAAAGVPAPEQPAAAALRPFDATGLLPCAMVRGQPSRECRFGVERRGAGAAVVDVLGSSGVTRRITFERGAPTGSNSTAELHFERFGELFLIRIGDERFEVPEEVVTGR
ncbi:SH3 domain-containing protein [Falsiroseomonas sp.]|uniref:SH3 domain-containing protein n=1 Tax=Falsiroseomonas sp. TaxID=2870721 RepID=UPI003563FA57